MTADHALQRRNILMSILGVCAAGPIAAQSPPNMMKVVVGSPPGALGDVVARLIAEKMGAILATPTIVDNKAGAAGLIAADLVAKSAGDGANVLVAADNVMTVNPFIYPKVPYDVQRDFAPIGVLGKADLVLVANASAGIRTMQDLIRNAQDKPDSITYSSGGVGHVTHLGVELIAARLGMKLRHVPYKGTSPALAAVVGGETNLMYLGASGAVPQIRSGRVVALAASGPRASETFKGVPTLREFHPDLDITVWFGLFASSKTPADIVARLNRALNAALERPEVIEKFAQYGMTTEPGTPAALAELTRVDSARFGELARTLKITVE